ncbi:MAG: hypothetical protein HQL35_12370, partial [Alphaproteobacteria bacterium]|nr:hypothetical protein [Alphaproteobacteria bacterium]
MADLTQAELMELYKKRPSDKAVVEAFDALKKLLTERDFNAAATLIDGTCIHYGDQMVNLVRLEDLSYSPEELEAIDPFTKLVMALFWGTHLSGVVPELVPRFMFCLMLSHSPFLTMVLKKWELGAFSGVTSAQCYSYKCRYDDSGEDKKIYVYVGKDGLPRFDLMDLFIHAYQILELYVEDQFGGDDEAFIRHYIEHTGYEYDPKAVQKMKSKYA